MLPRRHPPIAMPFTGPSDFQAESPQSAYLGAPDCGFRSSVPGFGAVVCVFHRHVL